jgi:Ca-activated chloride channel family protein
LGALLCGVLSSQSAAAFDLWRKKNSDVRQGNELLGKGKPGEALEKYDEAAKSLPSEAGVHLNRGLALQRSGADRVDQAMQAFKLATSSGKEPAVRARAHAGLGNAFFAKEDYDAAIEQYHRSLLLSPGNKDVAWNLELARQKKKQKEEQQKKDQEQQEQQDQQDQDKQDQQDQQDQDKKDQQDQQDQQQKQEQQQQDQQQKQEQQQKEEQQQDQQQEQKQEPAPREATQQLLDALDERQDDLQKEMAKRRAMTVPQGSMKDW